MPMPTPRLSLLPEKRAICVAAVFISTCLRGAQSPVTISESENTFTLDNGIVTAQIAKRSGD